MFTPPEETLPPSHTLDRESPSRGSESVSPRARDVGLDKMSPRDTLSHRHSRVPTTPITTTSPPQHQCSLFPPLVSHHQKQQGYSPSLHSMFLLDSRNLPYDPPAPPLFSVLTPQPLRTQPALKEPRMDNTKLPNIPITSPPPLVPSPGGKISTTPGPLVNRTPRKRRLSPPSTIHRMRKLRTLALPHETYSRFLAVAESNTLMNEETCGLLLVKEVWPGKTILPPSASTSIPGKSSRRRASDDWSQLVVTTLLIPKQRGADHMSLMDEEELVWSLTQEKDLMPVGWIHTHPSQSCFMSSVDLHTQSGFQRSVLEAIAVVCAPGSIPNLGIFRLTDPPGLQTVLGCTHKEAFHPHPDLPIYTDADKGHVQIRDSPLEVIDLRDYNSDHWF